MNTWAVRIAEACREYDLPVNESIEVNVNTFLSAAEPTYVEKACVLADYRQWAQLQNVSAASAAEARRGRWIKDEYEWTCSHCGESFGYYDNGFLHRGYFCPNCGAKMDGGDE